MKIIAPIYITLPRKTKKDKKVPINLNRYRNAYFYENNKVKKLFKEAIEDQIKWKTIKTPYGLAITIYYAYMSDLWNVESIVDKFLNDALVEYWCIPDDNMNYYIEKHVKVWWKDKGNPRAEIEII